MWVSEQARHSPRALSLSSPDMESNSACVAQCQCSVLGVVRAWQRNPEKILDASQVYDCAVGNLACVVWEKVECPCPLCAEDRQVREWWG